MKIQKPLSDLYLGIIVDERLTSNKHIDYFKGMTTYKNKTSKRARQYIDHDTDLMLYQPLVIPVLDYVDICYDGLLEH